MTIQVLPISLLNLPSPPSKWKGLSEQVCFDNPKAHGVAKPLFRAGVKNACITWKKGFSTQGSWITKDMIIGLHLQGPMSIRLNEDIKVLKSGDLFFLPAGSQFQMMGENNKWAQWLYFYLKDVKGREELAGCQAFVTSYSDAPVMYCLLRQILDAYKEPKDYARSIALGNAWFLNTLLRRVHLLAPYSEPSKSKALKILIKQIESRPGHDWSISEMADRLDISRSSLHRTFKKEFGLSPKEFIIQKRMELAASRLMTSKDSLESISRNTGYVNVYTFSRIFSQYHGLPPGKYRKKYSLAN